jgi:DNA gyrase subunit A
MDNDINRKDFGYIKPRPISQEMEESYLDYAMSVIVSRALPDVRDGLKPVHRRVLFAMNELGLGASSRFRKSATVVGEVLGKYHPHGDVAVYDSLVRMAQDFALRYPLVIGQGNFGSIDGDSAAAMRYTESKLNKHAEEILADIAKDTVDFVENYDGTRKEPKVLPGKFPNFLVNGTLGIAVGMATNIPPNNLSEIVDATTALIDDPELTADDLMQHIQGPDFPTGGEIYNFEEIKNAYTSGRGRIVMRSKAEIQETKADNFSIIVSEIPYQVNKSTLIEKIADLVKDKKIVGISDIRDESDKKIRIVIELKKDAYPKKILNQLYKHTQMQDAFHVNMVALVDGVQPRLLGIKDAILEHIKHRKVVIERKTKFDLAKAEAHAHILEGLLVALKNIEEVIKIIRGSATREDADKALRAKFKLSEKQSQAILDMRLSALAGLERKRIEADYATTLKLIKELKSILADPKKILAIIKGDLSEIKEKYGDERRTKVYKRSLEDFSQEDLIPDEQVVVTLTRGNYIKRQSISAYRSQERGGKGVSGLSMREEDLVKQILLTNTHSDVLFFTNKGRVFKEKVYDVPQSSRQSKGQAIVNLLQVSPDEQITNIINVDKDSKGQYLLMGTKKGLIKRTQISAYDNIRKTGIIAMGLRDQDALNWVRLSSSQDDVIIVTREAQAIRFNETQVRPMGRTATGVKAIRIKKDDEVIGMDVVNKSKVNESSLLVVTEKGSGKRTPISNYPVQKRSGSGVKTARLSQKTGKIVATEVVSGDEGEVFVVSKKAQVIRVPLRRVKVLNRSTSGVRLIRLNAGDSAVSVSVITGALPDIENTSEQADSGQGEPKVS